MVYRIRIIFNEGKTSFCASGQSAEEVKQRVISAIVPSVMRDKVKSINITEANNRVSMEA